MNVLKSRSGRLLIILLSGLLCLALGSVAVMAAGGPAKHGVDGQTFGDMVSDLATSDAAALAEHVGGAAAPGGMPAAHDVDGRTFGEMVSDLATSEPGAVAGHVTGCDAMATPEPEVAADQGAAGYAGGVPAAHPWDGEDFGRAVSGLATTDPGALVDHVSRR